MAVYGADVEELRRLAKTFSDAAGQLAGAGSTVSAQVAASPWSGPDAQQFRVVWSAQHTKQLMSAVQLLGQGASSLAKNADEQERTSTDDGGSGTGGHGTGTGGTGGSGSEGGTGGTPGLPADGASADSVRDWWDSLTEAEQQQYIQEHPGDIGSLDGIPAAVRDEANRLYLTEELARLESLPVPPDAGAAERLANAIAVLKNTQDVLEAPGQDAHLLLLDTTSGDPVRVAVALGDVDTADHVGVYTQGMNSRADTADGLSGPVAEMAALRRETEQQLAQSGRGEETTAMVVWMGYHAPQNLEVADPAYGAEGGQDLASFGEGIRANNADGHLTALGHSYGSYTTGMALQQTDAFDDFVAFGSPGIGTDDIGDIRTSSGEVYVLEAAYDPVADLGYFGPDTNHLDGVTNLSSSPQDGMTGSLMHSAYLADKSTSQYNIATVVAGMPDESITSPNGNTGGGDVVRETVGDAVRTVDRAVDTVVDTAVETATEAGRYLRYGWDLATGWLP